LRKRDEKCILRAMRGGEVMMVTKDVFTEGF
jgi:hypothetical protein